MSTPEVLERKCHKLLFAVQKSQRYHIYRVRFFERFAKALTILNLVFGASVVVTLLRQLPALALYGGAAISVFSMIDLVVGFGQRARDHRDLMRRFNFLERSILASKPRNEESLNDLVRERLEIEADEPPPLRVLDSICHNEVVRAGGYDSDQAIPIAGYQRFLAQWVDIRPHTLNKQVDMRPS